MTLSHWNPQTPDRLGLEWIADLNAGQYRTHALGSTQVAVMAMRSEGADTVTGLSVWRSIGAPPDSGNEDIASVYPWIFEVWPQAPGFSDSEWSSWTATLPNEDGAAADETRTSGSDNYAMVDALDTNYVANAAAKRMFFDVFFATGAATVASTKRLQLRLRTQVTGREQTGGGGGKKERVGYEIRLMKYSGGAATEAWVLNGDVAPEDDEETLQLLTYLPEFNPDTELPWTQADLRAFDNSTNGYAIRVYTATPNSAEAINVVRLRLEYRTADDDRVAWGLVRESAASTAEFVTAALGNLAGSSWSKASGTTYWYALRSANLGSLGGALSHPNPAGIEHRVASVADEVLFPAAGKLSVPYLTGPQAPGWTGYATGIYGADATSESSAGRISGAVGAFAGDNPMLRIVLTTAGVSADDTQPYAHVAETTIGSAGGFSIYVRQRLTSAASATFDGLQLPVRVDQSARPDAPLEVAVKRVSDDASFGVGTLTLTDYDALPTIGDSEWRLATIDLSSVTALVSGTQYYIQLDSDASTDAPWLVQSLYGNPDGQLGTVNGDAESSFGGETDYLALWVLSNRFDADLVGWLYNGPDAPGSVAATPSAVAGWSAFDGLDPQFCLPSTVPFHVISWDATELGADFVAYRVQRRNLDTGEWQTIAVISDEGSDTITFDDYEAPISQPLEYRVRVEAAIGAGAWGTATGAASEPAAAALFVTSNQDRSQVIALVETFGGSTELEFGYSEADERVVLPIHGRDTPLVFRPSERSGAAFTRTCLVDVLPVSGSSPKPGGSEATQALRAMAQDPDLASVCVRDSNGNSWVAAIAVPYVRQVVLDGRVAMVYADVEVVESSSAPTIVTEA